MPGTKLGPYEIVAPLGSGGMGEVYRARDSRLDRDIAIKVLPPGIAGDPGRMERFDREAKAVAALSHPNILALYDFGIEGTTMFAVTELLDGETLRLRLTQGAMPVGKAVAIGVQIAQGLAAAHDKGIVHRDLKPENVMLLPDGRVKILDFGLAKHVSDPSEPIPGGTMTQGTEAGTVLGTVGYMSPEQVRGLSVDARSDIFSLGTVLHEMITGVRAFRGDSSADTLSAILREEPVAVASVRPEAPPALDRILKRCLEKQPGERFRSAHDLALTLEAITTDSGIGDSFGPKVRSAGTAHVRFHRLTFRNGNIGTARFADEGQTVVYGAAWEGKPFAIYSSRLGSPESRDLGLPPASLHAVSVNGEMAISLGHHHTLWFQESGTLARASLRGGGVRVLQEAVARADLSSDGRSFALVRSIGGRYRIEYPAGVVLYESEGWIQFARLSRDGNRIAFSEHPVAGDSRGLISVLDRNGTRRVLEYPLAGTTGVCWSPDGAEVWFSGTNDQLENGIWGFAPGEAPRALYISPARIALHDVAGRSALIAVEHMRVGGVVGEAGGITQTDLSWFDGSVISDISSDGSEILFGEASEAENPHYAVFLRSVDGSPAVRLGEGFPLGLSPDGSQVLALTLLDSSHGALTIYPTGLGEPRRIEAHGIARYHWAGWHPGGREIFCVGSSPGRARRLYRQSLSGGPPALLLDEVIDSDWTVGLPIHPDGSMIVVRRLDGSAAMVHTETGGCETLHVLQREDVPIEFDADGKSLFVARMSEVPPRIERIDLATGERSRWQEIRPPEPTGIIYVGSVTVSPRAGRYAYSYQRKLSDLYMMDGLGS